MSLDGAPFRAKFPAKFPAHSKCPAFVSWNTAPDRYLHRGNEAGDALDEVGRIEQRRVALVGHFDDLGIGAVGTLVVGAGGGGR